MKDILIAVLASGGLFSLIQIILQRKWQKNDTMNDILDYVKKVDKKLDDHIKEQEESLMKQSRIRILRVADEIRNGSKISTEYIDNCIEDIDNYENYCSTHENFPNNKAVMAIDLIKTYYKNIASGGAK